MLSSLAVAAELAAGTLRAVPVTGVDLTRTLRAVWTEGRRLTGPALDLYAIAARSTRGLAGPGPAAGPAGYSRTNQEPVVSPGDQAAGRVVRTIRGPGGRHDGPGPGRPGRRVRVAWPRGPAASSQRPL